MSSVCKTWKKAIPAYIYNLGLYIDKDDLPIHTQYFKSNLEKFIRLESLTLSSTTPIPFLAYDDIIAEKLKSLSNTLRTLDIANSYEISDNSLELLTNLTDLNISVNEIITSAGIRNLTNLIHFNMAGNNMIDDSAFLLLTKLEELNISSYLGRNRITAAGISHLSNLRILDIRRSHYAVEPMDTSLLSHLVNLKIIGKHEFLLEGFSSSSDYDDEEDSEDSEVYRDYEDYKQ